MNEVRGRSPLPCGGQRVRPGGDDGGREWWQKESKEEGGKSRTRKGLCSPRLVFPQGRFPSGPTLLPRGALPSFALRAREGAKQPLVRPTVCACVCPFRLLKCPASLSWLSPTIQPAYPPACVRRAAAWRRGPRSREPSARALRPADSEKASWGTLGEIFLLLLLPPRGRGGKEP